MRTNSGKPSAATEILLVSLGLLVALALGCDSRSDSAPPTYDAPLLSGEEVREQLRTACAASKATATPMLVEFSAPWCSDCQALHGMKQDSVLANELDNWPAVTINVGQFDTHRDLLEAFEIKQIAHWAVLAPTDCNRSVATWPRLAQRKLEPASGAERNTSPADLANWLLALRSR